MNESEKNIETCLPESILAEVSALPTDPQFVSLVNESLDPLKQQAFQQAGSDAYNEVVASHKPYTFTSSVRQMKSNLILLLRRLWRFPFGSGTIRSLSDMWAHYIARLQGAETYGIPSRLSQLTDLPSAPLLVADRKISGADVEDGISLVRILSDSSVAVTELTDDTTGWTWNKALPSNITGSLKNVSLNCTKAGLASGYGFMIVADLDTLNLPYLEEFRFQTGEYGYNVGLVKNATGLTKIDTPNLKAIMPRGGSIVSNNCQAYIFYECPNLVEWNAPKLTRLWCSYVTNAPLEKVVLGTLETDFMTAYGSYSNFHNTANLIHFEIGAGTAVSLHLNWWNPTNVLADQDNLQQFLSNFRSFIVLRLANRKTTTALTLTLSAAVYNAVTGANSGWASQHTLAELGITDNDLTDLETELGITSATIYATWLDTYTGANGIHWNVNKAN